MTRIAPCRSLQQIAACSSELPGGPLTVLLKQHSKFPITPGLCPFAGALFAIRSGLPTIRELSGWINTPPFGRIHPFGWQGGSATMVNMKLAPTGSKLGPLRVSCMSAVESYTWSPSHDQRGMLRPSGTSSVDWW
jgi:hypothetical protein